MKEEGEKLPSLSIICTGWLIMEWISLKVAGEYFYSLLDAEFFPKWISFLRSWLSQDDMDLALVAKWYLEWKEIFPLQCR